MVDFLIATLRYSQLGRASSGDDTLLWGFDSRELLRKDTDRAACIAYLVYNYVYQAFRELDSKMETYHIDTRIKAI